MAVQEGPTDKRYAGNGVTTTFAIPFLLILPTDLDVFIDGVEQATGYIITGAGEPNSTITFTPAPVTGADIYLVLNVPFERLNDYQENGDFLASTVNGDFDRIWQALKQLFRYSRRALTLGDTDIDGAGLYRANNNGITDLASAAGVPSAATNWQDVLDYVAGILATGQGPINNAANVSYVFPDNVARAVQDLSNYLDPLKGSHGIGHYNSGGTIQTVGQVLEALRAVDANLTNQLADTVATLNAQGVITARQYTGGLSPLVVDMHFGTLCGAGWTASEPPFSVSGYSIATSGAVSAGALDVPVISTTNFAVGMLIAYVATDGKFYPARIHSIEAGPSLRLDRQTAAPIASGGLIWNVYRDDAHPNAAGGNLIADDALRQLEGGRLRQLEWRGNDGSIWRAIGGAVLASVTAADYKNPGTATVGERPASVTGSGVGQGVNSAPVALQGGDYIARVAINTGLRTGGFSGSVEIFVDETRADGQILTISTSGVLVGYDGTSAIELPFSSAAGSVISVRITSPNGGAWVFTAGALEYHRLNGQALNLNRGRHVLLGDSWFVSGSAIHNSMIARLPDAEVLSAGISGNKADQLIARFGADVVPLAPDYVWVMVGTNDYYASVTPGLFEQQILQLRRLIQGIGAQAIFFTPSVGAVTFVPQQLHPSRRYALNVNYHEVAPVALGPGVNQRSASANIQGLSVAAGATVTAWVFPANTRQAAWLRFLAVNTAGVNVRFEYCSAADGSGGVEPTVFNTAAVVRDVALPRVSDTALRLICIRINNPTGSPVSVSLTADVCWQQSLV